MYESDGVTPATGVIVCLYTGDPCGSPSYVTGAGTNSSGVYSLTDFPAGTYTLRTANNGTIYLNEWWASGLSSLDCIDAQTITVGVGETVTGKDFQLNSGSIITGTVYESDGVTPATGVIVSLYTGDPCGSASYVTGAGTNSSGIYTLTGFPAGTYYLRTSNNGTIYLNEWWGSGSSSLDCGGAESITVGVGETVAGKDFQLNSGSIISGTVYQSDGITPATGVIVSLYTGNPCGSASYVTGAGTNSSGIYTLTGFPSGTYYLRTSNNGTIYLNEWWGSGSSSLDCGDAESITVGVGETVTGKDFQLNSGAIISGTVYQNDGSTAAPGVIVSLYTGDPCGSAIYITGAGTNPSGDYSLSGFPAGTYFLRTSNNGTVYLNEWWGFPLSSIECNGAQTITVNVGQTVTGKDFQLDPIAELVYFEDFSGEPIFTFYEGIGDHRFQWNESAGIYEIEHIYDEQNIHRYAITPQFQRMVNQSFVVQVDLNTKYMTWGQHMAICFGEEDALVPGGPDNLWHISSNWDSSYSFNDGLANLWVTPAADKNKWYSFRFYFDYSTKTVDLLVTERDTGTIFYENNGVPFDPRPFNTVFLGNHLHNAEGSGGELHYDNIVITAIRDCPACSGDTVVIQDTTFTFDTVCECVGTESITIGNGVTIERDAVVTFIAPIVNMQSGIHVEEGAVVSIIQE